MHVLVFASLLASSAALTSAHGFVSTITINGKAFTGTLGPSDQPASSIIRQVSDPNPIKGAHNPAVNCGRDARASALVAAADPGSPIMFDWTGADLKNWPHNTGPMLTYMAACGSITCDKFDSTQAKWFKVQQDGRQSDGQWVQANLMTGAPAPARIPANLAAGDYLIRHEIIALHLAIEKGGAEFYVSCTQLRVSGNGTGTPTPGDLVSLPGAYDDNDPGIFDPDVFNLSVPYPFPGPKVASFVPDRPSDDGPAPAPPPRGAQKGFCRLKKSALMGSNHKRMLGRIVRYLTPARRQ